MIGWKMKGDTFFIEFDIPQFIFMQRGGKTDRVYKEEICFNDSFKHILLIANQCSKLDRSFY